MCFGAKEMVVFHKTSERGHTEISVLPLLKFSENSTTLSLHLPILCPPLRVEGGLHTLVPPGRLSFFLSVCHKIDSAL